MNEGIIVAAITASATILGAAVTYLLTKRHELAVQWQNEKLNHYKVLLSSLSDLAVDGTDKDDANMRFALAANTIALVAPQDVITALMAYHEEVKFSNQNRSPARHDELLRVLLLAIRKDIGRTRGDDIRSFNFHLIGAAPAKSQKGCR